MPESAQLHERFDALIKEISKASADGKLTVLEIFHIIKRAIELLNVLSSFGSLLQQDNEDNKP